MADFRWLFFGVTISMFRTAGAQKRSQNRWVSYLFISYNPTLEPFGGSSRPFFVADSPFRSQHVFAELHEQSAAEKSRFGRFCKKHRRPLILGIDEVACFVAARNMVVTRRVFCCCFSSLIKASKGGCSTYVLGHAAC